MNVDRDLRAADQAMSAAQRTVNETVEPTAEDLRHSTKCVADAVQAVGNAISQLAGVAESLERMGDRARRGF